VCANSATGVGASLRHTAFFVGEKGLNVKQRSVVRSAVLIVGRVKIAMIWHVTPCSLIDGDVSEDVLDRHSRSGAVPNLTYQTSGCENLRDLNLWALHILYIGQAYRHSSEYTFYIFSQQMYYLIIFLLDFHHLRLFLSTKCRVLPNVTLLGS